MGKRKQQTDTCPTFIPKISDTSKRIALRRLENLDTKGVPHFMLETQSNLMLHEPLEPVPPISSHNHHNPSTVKEEWDEARRLSLNAENQTVDLDLNEDNNTPNEGDNIHAAMSENAVLSSRRVGLDENIFTFQPKVSSASVRIAEKLGSDFMSRQQQHIDRQKKLVEQASLHYRDNGHLSPLHSRSKKVKVLKESGDANNNAVAPEDCQTEGQIVNSDSESGDKKASSMSTAQAFPLNRTKTQISHAGLQRLLDGPYTNVQAEMVIKRHQARYHSHPTVGKNQLLADSVDSESKADDASVSTSLSRSKTMPSLSRPKLTRKLTIVSDGERLRQAKEIVEKAIKYRKVFTIQGGYSTIRQSLRRRGWVEKFYRIPGPPKKKPKSKQKHSSDDDDDDSDDDDNNNGGDDDDDDDDDDGDDDDDNDPPKIPPWEEDDGIYGIMSRMVRNVNPLFIWVLKRDVIDYRFLSKDQMVNHYCKAGSFTTKVGLCVNMKNVPWFENADPDTFFPRCYRLSQDEDKLAFIDDYRLTACMNILKIVVSQNAERVREEIEAEMAEPATDNGDKSPPSDEAADPDHKDTSTSVPAEDATPREKTEPAEEQSVDSPKASSLTPRGNKKQKKKVLIPMRVLELAMRRCEKFLAMKNHDDIDVTNDDLDVSDSRWDQFLQHFYQLAHDEGVIQSIPKNVIVQCENLLNRLKTKWPQFEMDGTRNVWIVKPGAKSRGRGIICYDKLDDMLKLVSSQVVKKDSKFVVQKYMERPLLIYNTKFDIRQWFLVTDWNPLTLWFYQDSYLRFCSQQYTLDNFDEAIHLSNNAIQKNKKNGPRSSKLPSDNMWTHEEFQEYLKTRKQPTLWEDVIYPGMKKAITCALLVTQDLIEYRKSSFELYGADFMLTEDYQPMLIEINSSPSMEASTQITARLCANVLEDTVKVGVDRKYDRNCDIGRFELAYKQPLVTVPPYIGINLSVDGQAIRKPGAFRSLEPYFTPRNTIRPSLSTDKAAETKKSQGNGSPGHAVPTVSNSHKSNVDSNEAVKSTISFPSGGKSTSQPNTHRGQGSKSESQDSGIKSSSTVSSKTESRKLESSDNHIGFKQVAHPSPPSVPKVSAQTPYLSGLTTRRIVSRSSVSTNYTIPPTILERHSKPSVSVSNVESTDIRTMKPSGAIKGCVDALIDGTWGRTCSECGSGMNLRLHNANPNCRCRQDSVIVTMESGRARSAHFNATPIRHNSSYKSPRPPSASSTHQSLKMKNSNSFKTIKMERVLLKYTDAGIKSPASQFAGQANALPKLVRRFIGRRMVPYHDTSMVQNAVYIDTSQVENSLSIVSQSYTR